MITAQIIASGRVRTRNNFVLVAGFIPPDVSLAGAAETTALDLTATLGDFVSSGSFTILFYLAGSLVGTMEAKEPGNYTLAVPVDWHSLSGAVDAWIDVTSSEISSWCGHAEWIFPAASYITINLGVEFVDYPGVWAPAGWFGPDKPFGPYADNRWVYTHADDGAMTAQADDDLAVNGSLIHPDYTAGYVVPGGATELLLVLPAGSAFTLNIWNHTGQVWARGYLRLYNRPI